MQSSVLSLVAVASKFGDWSRRFAWSWSDKAAKVPWVAVRTLAHPRGLRETANNSPRDYELTRVDGPGGTVGEIHLRLDGMAPAVGGFVKAKSC